MSGTALTTFSPSSVRISRSVVCVAGCCGPKFSVHRYSLSGDSVAERSETSNGMADFSGQLEPSACGAGDDRKVVSFAAAAQRIIFAQRKCLELFGHENAPQVGVTFEANPEHVVDFPLEPIRGAPKRDGGRQRRVGIVDERFD